MSNRREFIKAVSALPLLGGLPAWAASLPSLRNLLVGAAGPAVSLPPAEISSIAGEAARHALIIGNSAYASAPLDNPANDAKAMAGLLKEAGFTTSAVINARRTDMLAAIEKFGAAAKRAETKQVLFYYAGHGAQLDWRNYLLPVDAVVESAEHVKQRCVDLAEILGQFKGIKDKTFILILDACRNNPFGIGYVPPQKGLSQFDAPVGSLLAYATSPGNVASDGDGKNGLYTENLVRELSRRNTRIEDALKRVRLNVRLSSEGAQIPWETTSLEGDVFFFPNSNKLSEAELLQQLEADITEWGRIKESQTLEDWAGYLRNFPNGRFAEIAQLRLARLLADKEREAEARRQAERARLERERLQRLEEERRQLEAQRAAEERRMAEERQRAEQQRLAEERRQAEIRRLSEDKRRAEEQRLAAERARREAEEKKRREEEAQHAEERRREQAVIAALAEQARQQEEERKREAERQAQEAAAQRRAQSGAAPTGEPALVLGPGLPVPELIPPSNNPFSAGRFLLGRVYTVGDEATVKVVDMLTGLEQRKIQLRITQVDHENDRVIFSDGKVITDLMGNLVRTLEAEFETPMQQFPAELQVGRKWTAALRQTLRGQITSFYYDFKVVKRETITVPAGTFDTFFIDGHGFNRDYGSRLESRVWVVPGVFSTIRREHVITGRNGQKIKADRNELVSLRQQVRGRTT